MKNKKLVIFVSIMLVTSFIFVCQVSNVKSIENTSDIDECDIELVIQDFVSNSENDVSAEDIVSFLNGNAQKQFAPSDDIWYFGDEYEFNDRDTWLISVAALASDKFVVAYRDFDSPGYGTARIGEISGNVINFGEKYVFNSDYTNYISVVALTSDKYVVTYNDGDSRNGTACIGEVSGLHISHGPEYVFLKHITTWISAAALSSDKFVVAYHNNSDPHSGAACVGFISDNWIGFGEEYVFNPSNTVQNSVVVFSENKFVVVYGDYLSGNWIGKACVGTVQVSAIDFGPEYLFNPDSTSYISTAALSSHKFIVAYKDGGNSYFGTARVGAISGDVIGFGSEYVFSPSFTNFISVAALTSDKFVVTYGDGSNSYFGNASIGDISGNVIDFGEGHVFNPDWTFGTSTAVLSSEKYVVTYIDGGDNNFGKAIIGISNSPPDIPTITGPQIGVPGDSYTYSFTATDTDEHQVEYYIEWGDGNSEGWYGPFDSGDPQSWSHTWNAEDTYTIRCKARDEFGEESEWGEFTVIIPRNKSYDYNFKIMNWLFERFPNSFPILRYLLK